MLNWSHCEIKLSKEAIIGYVVVYVGIVPLEGWIELVGIILKERYVMLSKAMAWIVQERVLPCFLYESLYKSILEQCIELYYVLNSNPSFFLTLVSD